eukprot:7338200-Pyramimonas_sp.AAC.1
MKRSKLAVFTTETHSGRCDTISRLRSLASSFFFFFFFRTCSVVCQKTRVGHWREMFPTLRTVFSLSTWAAEGELRAAEGGLRAAEGELRAAEG